MGRGPEKKTRPINSLIRKSSFLLSAGREAISSSSCWLRADREPSSTAEGSSASSCCWICCCKRSTRRRIFLCVVGKRTEASSCYLPLLISTTYSSFFIGLPICQVSFIVERPLAVALLEVFSELCHVFFHLPSQLCLFLHLVQHNPGSLHREWRMENREWKVY